MMPRLNKNTIYDINLKHLQQNGIKGFITDLDNTLVETDELEPNIRLTRWLHEVQSLGFKIVIVSNNDYERVSAFADPLQIPYIHKARKPLVSAFNKALSMMNICPDEAAVIGDQLLTDVFGGNRLGLYTILVKPISLSNEKLTTKFNRRVEKWILHTLKKKGMHQEEKL